VNIVSIFSTAIFQSIPGSRTAASVAYLIKTLVLRPINVLKILGHYSGFMSLESAKAFLQDATSGKINLDVEKLNDPDLASRLAYAHSFGYDFTRDELREVAVECGHPISMEEAEAMVGGQLIMKSQDQGGGVPTNTSSGAAYVTASPVLGSLGVAAFVALPLLAE
jgi:hypothetical protein